MFISHNLKDAKGPQRPRVEPTFPTERRNVCWGTWRYNKNTQKCRRVHSSIRTSGTNLHPSVWKLTPLLMKQEILAHTHTHTKVWCPTRTQSIGKKTIILWMQDVEDQTFIPGSVGSFRADLTQVHVLLQTLHNSRQQMQFSVRSSFQAEVG